MLRARWLGRVPYAEGDQLQRALHERATDDYLLLLEHPHVYTLGTTADVDEAHWVGVLNGGGPQITAQTSSGGITLEPLKS